MINELQQLHDRKAMVPKRRADLTLEDIQRVLRYDVY